MYLDCPFQFIGEICQWHIMLIDAFVIVSLENTLHCIYILFQVLGIFLLMLDKGIECNHIFYPHL